MSKWQAHWDRLERLLSEALESVRLQLRTKTADLVAEFIDHNEFGVAFETLIEEIEELGIELNSTTRAKLREAGEMMSIPWSP